MFGSVPGVFKSSSVAFLVAKAYAEEEEVEWLVIYKYADKNLCFNVCRFGDLFSAELDGWKRFSDNF